MNNEEEIPQEDRPKVVPSEEFDYDYEEGIKNIQVPEFDIEEPDVENHWWNEGDRIRRVIALQTDAMVRTTVKSFDGDDDKPGSFFYNEGDEIFQFLSRTSPYFIQQVGFVINTCIVLRLNHEQVAPIAFLAGQESHRFDMSPDELMRVIERSFNTVIGATLGSAPPKFHNYLLRQMYGLKNTWTRYAFQGQRNPSDGSPKPRKEEDGEMGM